MSTFYQVPHILFHNLDIYIFYSVITPSLDLTNSIILKISSVLYFIEYTFLYMSKIQLIDYNIIQNVDLQIYFFYICPS